MRAYIGYAVFSSAILVVWHFPPNERFTLPLLPLCLAGLFVEMRSLALMIRQVWAKPARDQKVAAGLIAAVVTCAILVSVSRHLEAGFSVIPAGYAQGADGLGGEAGGIPVDDGESAGGCARDGL